MIIWCSTSIPPEIQLPRVPAAKDVVEKLSVVYQTLSPLSHENNFEPLVLDARLIRLFYENFHSAHPFLVPSPLYEKRKYSVYLHQVVQFIGSQYSMILSGDTLYESTALTLSPNVERTPTMVQALHLYSIIMRAHNEISQAESSLTDRSRVRAWNAPGVSK